MMMTAAGTVPAAKVFVMGVGVAGLQAIATARRMGAIVTATDVRPATKEQVESLGAKFLAVEDEEFKNAQTAGGYAKEMSKEYQAKQAALAKHETAPSSQPKGTSTSSTPQTSQPQTTQPVAPAAVTATVSGSGVRMRSTADPNGAIVGQLKSGEKVVILGDAIGTDGKAWAKVQGTVTASGKDIQGEGYVRNDLLNR